MPTHEEVIAENPLEAPAPFWDNVYYALNGFAAFLIMASALGGFVCCCVALIDRVERYEEELADEAAQQRNKQSIAAGDHVVRAPAGGRADLVVVCVVV
eukprot:CAMPEP_0171073788 /NCGR_PEP_ID=MMETSP0766_2-20121228/11725_1 /TAXON_ID=439317 /ORGANISM="Gambierdiscus australes, Strain CAWD 149" /LENGTH=98 /DNA_ID=CAMNT_0011530515 /DNA_START=85 /DNA_END=382 /DNA_ORIENTATION=-